MYYRAYLEEVDGVCPDFKSAAILSLRRQQRQFKSNKSRIDSEENINSIARDFKRGFVRWKIAHNL